MDPFYDVDGVQIYVRNLNTLVLRLDDISQERDTGFIELPTRFASDRKERFRFYMVHNYCEDYGNELGLWIYVYDPAFNYKIKGCSFSIIKGLNTIDLPPTILLDSVVGMYRSPCYEIVNNEAILEFMIYLPKMTFETPNVHRSAHNKSKQKVEVNADISKRVKKVKEVNLGEELSAAYQNMMNEANYDVFFVVDGKKIGSFKFPLCAVSDVFSAAFKEHTKESQTGEIAIYDFDYRIVKMFVDSLHTHKIYFDDDPMTTLKLKMLANKYNVASIERAALNAFNVMDVNRYNFVAIYR